MRIITIKEYSELIEVQKEIYDSFINATYFDCFKAVDCFLKYKGTFREKKLFESDYKNAPNHNQQEYVKQMAAARYAAVKAIEKLPIIARFPLEFFEEYSFPQRSNESHEILLEYRYQKTLAHGAFLFR